MNSKKVDLIEANQIIDAYQNTHKTVDLSEAKQELKAYEGIAESTIVMKGPIKIANLEVGSSTLIIDGDLNVDETIQDCKGVDSSLMIVLGNVACKNLITLSGMHIAGNLKATNVILGDSHCDHSLVVGGDIESPAILDYGHDIRSAGPISTKDIHIFNRVEDMNGCLESNLKTEDMVEDIVKEDHGENLPDLPKTIKYIEAGGKKFRKL